MRKLLLAVAFGLLAGSAAGDDPPKKLTPEERKELEGKLAELMKLGSDASNALKYADAAKHHESAIAIARLLYGQSDHPDLATSIVELAHARRMQEKAAVAESVIREGLAMRKRLATKDASWEVAQAHLRLAQILYDQGRLREAESSFRESLRQYEIINKDRDQGYLAICLSDLAITLKGQGKLIEAESLCRRALKMRKRLRPGDSAALMVGLSADGRTPHTSGPPSPSPAQGGKESGQPGETGLSQRPRLVTHHAPADGYS